MWLNLKLSHKGLILVAVPLAFEFIFVCTLTTLLSQAENEIKREAHARQVIALTNGIMKNILGLFMAVGGTEMARSPMFTKQYESAVNELPGQFDHLIGMLQDDPQKQGSAREIRSMWDDGVRTINDCRIKYEHGEIAKAARLLPSIKHIAGTAIDKLNAIVVDQHKVETDSPEKQAKLRAYVQIILAVGVALNVVLAFWLAIFFSKGISKRVNTVADNATRLAAGGRLNAPLAGSDEIANLDSIFHNMATELAQAKRNEIAEREEVERLKQEFVMILSHELRSPLTSLKFLLSLLKEGTYGEINEQGLKKVSIADRNITRLVHLIQELLDIETLESGSLSITKAKMSLSTAIEKAVEAVSGPAQLKQIEIEQQLAEASIVADDDRLVQVTINLLANAIKFSPEKSTIKVVSQCNATSIQVNIIDQGRGVPASHQQSIFDRFRQVEASDSKEKGGVGLGLAICKAIIEKHGGMIGVESEIGRGSNFWFRLPTENEID